jgi:hypothetical protein
MTTLLHKASEVNGASEISWQSGVSSVKAIGGAIAIPVDDKSFIRNGERHRGMWQGPRYHLLRPADSMLEAPGLRVDLGF